MDGFLIEFGFITSTRKIGDNWFMDCNIDSNKKTFLMTGAAINLSEACEVLLGGKIEAELKSQLIVFVIEKKEGYDGILLRFASYKKGTFGEIKNRLIESVY